MHQFTNRNYIHTIYGVLTMVVAFLIAIIFRNYWIGVMGSFGSLLFMYYVPANKDKTMTQLFLVSSISCISFPISACLSKTQWLTFIWIALLTYIVQYLMSVNGYIGPGLFFVLMINGMIASLSHLPLLNALFLSLYAVLGVVIAVVFAMIENRQFERYQINLRDIIYKTQDIQPSIRALMTSVFAFLAYFIGYHLKLNNYYWILVSALTILQSENVIVARKRQIAYIGAGIIGTLIAFVIYSLVNTPIVLIGLSFVFMALISLYMPKSYLVGNFFTTPIALILFKIVRPEMGNTLIKTRILAIFVGTIIGLIGVLYYDYIMNKNWPIANKIEES